MAKNQKRQQSGKKPPRGKRDTGNPGGGAGRVDRVGETGIWPASGPTPEGRDMPIVTQAELGQGARGATGAADSGSSEIHLEDVTQSDERQNKRKSA